MDTQLKKAVDVLSDMICNSIFSQKEMEKEREVILDEIDSVEDTPDDLVQDIFIEKLYPGNSLGYPILGSRESVQQITRDILIDFYQSHYTGANMIIAAAGSVNHEKLVEICEKQFKLPQQYKVSETMRPLTVGEGQYLVQRKVNQAHICLGTQALPYHHHLKFELLLLNTVLGVGMGSRLFQNIRERYGVAYSIYSFVDFFKDDGLLAIYLGTDKGKKDLALKLIQKELSRLTSKPLSKSELSRVKAQLKGNLFLGLENTSRRMSRLAKMEIYLNRYHTIDEMISTIDNVTSESIHSLANHLFDRQDMLQVIFLPN
jgi:predicted Zn-dependent peptidase